MLDYIMQKINGMTGNKENEMIQEQKENETILECAHLIQELEEISIEGSPMNQERDISNALDISLEEDVELESIEVSLSDGRILDTPADILMNSSAYAEMKTYDDFYNEANKRDKSFLESQFEFDRHTEAIAEQEYNKYKGMLFQEELFAMGRLSVDDPTIQWVRMIDFGPMDPSDPKSHPYVVRMNIAYESVAPRKILIKQRDTVTMAIDPYPTTFTDFAAKYTEYMESHGFKIPTGKTIWDVVVPKRILIPVDPVDAFAFFIEAENLISDDRKTNYIYIGYTMPIKSKVQGIGAVGTKQSLNLINGVPNIRLSTIVDNNKMMKEYASEPVEESELRRVIQEAIDFGDSGSSETSDTPPSTGDSDASSTNDAPATTGDDNNAETNDSVDTTKVDSRDVSPQIADAVEKKTEEQKAISDEIDAENENPDADSIEHTDSLNTTSTDLPDDNLDENPDLNTDGLDNIEKPIEGSDEESIDDKLADLNTEGELSDDGTDMGNVDISSMSMEDLKKLAEKKLEKMPMGELQAFLNDATESPLNEETNTEVQQEAFIITKKNINAELDACLRNTLGDLNNSTKNVAEIVTEFKKDGKKLNRALSKACKYTDVYDEKERTVFTKLNKCLADLIVTFVSDPDKKALQVIKRLIKAFTSQAVAVGKIIEKHKGDVITSNKKKDESVKQESFNDIELDNSELFPRRIIE